MKLKAVDTSILCLSHQTPENQVVDVAKLNGGKQMKQDCQFLSQIVYFSFIVCCIFFINACDQDAKEKFPPRTTKFPANESYPQGYAEVVMGDHLMRIPGEITQYVDDNGSMRMHAIWPEFKFSDKKYIRTTSRQNEIDSITIYIYTPEYSFNKKDTQWIEKYKKNKVEVMKRWVNQWQQLKEFPDFLVILKPSNGIPEYFRLKDNSILDPFGFPVVVHCDAENSDMDWGIVDDKSPSEILMMMPKCGGGIIWPDGHRFKIRFYRKHIKDFFNIYQKTLELHNSFIINTTNYEITNGIKQ